MVMQYCNVCNQRFSYNPWSGDYVHTCNSGNATLDNEDRPLVGQYTDVDGTVKGNIPQGQIHVPLAAKNYGRRSYLDGQRVHDLTSRGNRTQTHVTIPQRNYIEVKNNAIRRTD